MSLPKLESIRSAILEASKLRHRLVLLVGPGRSGKTATLQQLHEEEGWPLINVNLELSERLLDLPSRKRAIRAARLLDDIVEEQEADIIVLDNIELLFQPDLQQDPLRLLQSLSRNRTVVSSWRGSHIGTSLAFAAPDHPEYRHFESPEALVVSTVGATDTIGALPAQEQSA